MDTVSGNELNNLSKKLSSLFTNFDLTKKIKLNENYPVSLYWTNDSILTRKVKQLVKESVKETGYNQYTQLKKELDKLKEVPLWLRLEDSILKLSAFDIYHTLCMHFKNGEYEDQLFNAQEVSFVSPTGPFKDLSIVDCIHNDTLEAFILCYVIQNNLPQRLFRLDTEGQALISYGEFNERNLRINVDQITDSGVLFSSDNYELLEVIDDAQYFKFQMTTKHLSDYFNSNSELTTKLTSDMFFTNNIMESFSVNSAHLIKSLKYDSADTGKFYLFCRYTDMLGSHHATEFKNFVDKFRSEIKKVA